MHVIFLLDTKLNDAEGINAQVDKNNSNSILNMINKQLNILYNNIKYCKKELVRIQYDKEKSVNLI